MNRAAGRRLRETGVGMGLDEDITYDMEAAIARFGGDESLAAEVVEMYAADVPQLVRTVDEAIKAGDLPSAAAGCHKVRNNFLMFNVEPPATLSRRIELAAKAGEAETVGLLWPKAKAAFLESVVVLRDAAGVRVG